MTLSLQICALSSPIFMPPRMYEAYWTRGYRFLPSSSIMCMFCTSSLSALVICFFFLRFFIGAHSLAPCIPCKYRSVDIPILFVTHHTHSAFFFVIYRAIASLFQAFSSCPLPMSIHTHSISHQYPTFSFVRTGLHCRTCGPPFSFFFFFYSDCNHFCSWDCHSIPCINFLHYLC
jgi:hypothetical protein